MSAKARILMLGLDGMTFKVLDPAFAAGHMPNLKSLLDRGVSGTLTSTVPPYTPPGWTSIFTGVNPGRHGIFGFMLGNVQRDDGLVRLDRVAAPAIWNVANAQGSRVGLFNVPMTYPPPPVDGWAVSGMLTPEGGGGTPKGFTQPSDLAEVIAGVTGGYEIDIDVDYDEDWKSTAIEDRLSTNLDMKRKALSYLLQERDDVDILFAVFEAPDRIMHVHYKYMAEDCEHFHRPEGAEVRARIWAFLDELDGAIADLLAWAGNDGYVVTMSDHGFGPKDKAFNMNIALREWGFLSLKGLGGLGSSGGIRKAARAVKSRLPKSVQQRAKSAAQRTIDWSKTRAFSAPIPQQGIYVNLKGREPMGIVDPADYEAVRDEIVVRLEALVDPDDGLPVVDRVYRREEVMKGSEAERAADLFPVCRGYSYELFDGIYSVSILGDTRELPRGFHHMDGIFGLAGPGIEPSSGHRAHLYDIAPTSLYLAGLKVPPMDGEVLTRLLPALTAERPVRIEQMELPNAGAGAVQGPYSAAEEAQIEESLRNLGYL
jgi:predicted AlkP superfamily phosphohydrolase/phosphomutase